MFPSGSQYTYSNSENIIVGLIVEAVTGGSYADALRTQVYEPLGLEATTPAGGHRDAGPDVPRL